MLISDKSAASHRSLQPETRIPNPNPNPPDRCVYFLRENQYTLVYIYIFGLTWCAEVCRVRVGCCETRHPDRLPRCSIYARKPIHTRAIYIYIYIGSTYWFCILVLRRSMWG